MAHRPTMASEDDLREQFPREPDLRLQNLSQTLQRALTADQEMHDDPDSASGQACRTIDRVCMTQIETAGLGIDYHGDRVAPTVAAWIQLSGSARLQQGDNAAELTAGDLCLLRGARPLSLQLPGAASLMLVEVPEQELVDRFRHWRHALLKPVQASSGAPAVFQDAVRSVWRWGEELGSEIADGIASAMIDLLGAMICFAVSSSPDCVSRALHQRERVRRIARAQLRNPELSVELIAQAACLGFVTK